LPTRRRSRSGLVGRAVEPKSGQAEGQGKAIMAITLPPELEPDLIQRAQQLGWAPAEVVRLAVVRFLYLDRDLQAELDFWQELSWRAWTTIEP
jgi:hypothetical protein